MMFQSPLSIPRPVLVIDHPLFFLLALGYLSSLVLTPDFECASAFPLELFPPVPLLPFVCFGWAEVDLRDLFFHPFLVWSLAPFLTFERGLLLLEANSSAGG